MRWRSAWLTACSCVVLAAAGCGGHGSKLRATGPRLPRAVADRLAKESDAVARRLDAGDRCGAAEQAQRLLLDTRNSIQSVPAAFQETLMGTANDLADRVGPVCSPENAQPPPEPKGKGKGHGKKHGKGGDEGGGG